LPESLRLYILRVFSASILASASFIAARYRYPRPSRRELCGVHRDAMAPFFMISLCMIAILPRTILHYLMSEAP